MKNKRNKHYQQINNFVIMFLYNEFEESLSLSIEEKNKEDIKACSELINMSLECLTLRLPSSDA